MPSSPNAPQPAPIDWAGALARAQALPVEDRLCFLLAEAGCESAPGRPRLITRPAARLWAIGGMPFHALESLGLAPSQAAELARSSMGAAGGMSYLALPGGSARSAYGKIAGLGHFSIAHAASVSLVVAGVSCAVENEFNSQRDLAHLARVTENRADCQRRPPLALLEPALAPAYERALDFADALRSEAAALDSGLNPRDANEALNALFPASKATVFVITATLRNFQKLLAAQADPGKEKEYRLALGLIRERLGSLWPELFAQEGS